MNWLDNAFRDIGVIVVMGAVLLLLALGFTIIQIEIEYAIKTYKIKHRFNKKPLAKCYCVDCKYYSKEDHYCSYNEIFVIDNFYCRDANPRKEKQK